MENKSKIFLSLNPIEALEYLFFLRHVKSACVELLDDPNLNREEVQHELDRLNNPLEYPALIQEWKETLTALDSIGEFPNP